LGLQHQGLGILFNKEYTPHRFNGKPRDEKEEVKGALQELTKRDILQREAQKRVDRRLGP